MNDKVGLVTGATRGIGEMTARALALRGVHVLLVGRNEARCEDAVRRIRAESGNPAVEHLVADLSLQADVRRLAAQVKEKTPKLDILVNNAGGMFLKRQETADGIELTLALNHLAYFLLTNLLLDCLHASASARIVNVASDAHRMVRGIDFDDIQARRRYRGLRVYGQSKLANLLFTFELARRLRGSRVSANALHPGLVATSIFSNNGAFGWIMTRAASLFGLSSEDGAQTSIYLATSPEVEGASGQYFENKVPSTPSPAARDEAAARRLWKVSEELTGLSATV